MNGTAAGALFALAFLAATPGARAQPNDPPGTGKAEKASTMNGINLQFAEFRGDAVELARRIDAMLAAAAAPARDEAPLAVVSPHAGYVYSGPIAAFAYRAVHDMTVKSKAVVAAFYDRAPRLS